MRRFVKTSVPAEGYEQVKKVGERWLVHLEGTPVEGGLIECYECMTDGDPDIAELTAELQTWKAYVAERELAVVKMSKMAELEAYDASDAVNSFRVNVGNEAIDTWITPEQRSDYKNSIDAAELLGMTEVHPVLNGVPVTLDIQTAKTALARIQIYANQCYGVTEQHKAAINALNTIEAVEGYDHTTGYPPQLIFEV